MKLSESDRHILTAIQFSADIPIAEFARKLGQQTHVVRHTLSKALEAGAIARRAYVNTYRLGLSSFALFVTLDSRSAESRKKFRDQLFSSPNVVQLIELGGSFDFAVILCVHNPEEVSMCLERMSKAAGTGLAEKLVHVRTGWYHFGARYLESGSKKLKPMPFFPGTAPITIDATDHRILVVYSQSPDGNEQEMARKLGMALSTMQYRLEKLRSQEVIVGTIYQIVPEVLGYQSFRLLLSTRRPEAEFRKALLDWVEKNDSVVSMMCGFGPWDYELRVETQTTALARDVSDSLIDGFKELVTKVNIVPVAKILKVSTYPFEIDSKPQN